jgi:hypothetical protein
MILSQYTTQVRRLLNDAQANYWSNDELRDYINEARRQVARDTLCVRLFQNGTLQAGQEQYEYTDVNLALPQGNQVVDIINITVIWGTLRYPLGYAPFTAFSAYFRSWVNFQRIPAVFTIYNARQFWVAYVPDINYAAEFDTAILPLNLANDNTVDTIPSPYDEAVKFFAASLARLKLQQYKEYEAQQQIYDKYIARLGAMPPRRIPYVIQNEVF